MAAGVRHKCAKPPSPPLGDHIEPEFRPNEALARTTLRESRLSDGLAHKGLVDLHFVERHPHQRQQAGMARAEIVDRQVDAANAQAGQDLHRAGGLGMPLLLGDLQHQRARRHAVCCSLSIRSVSPGSSSRQRRNIDSHAQTGHCRQPRTRQRLIEIVSVKSAIMPFCSATGIEAHGGTRSAIRPNPTRQRLRTPITPVIQRVLGWNQGLICPSAIARAKTLGSDQLDTGVRVLRPARPAPDPATVAGRWAGSACAGTRRREAEAGVTAGSRPGCARRSRTPARSREGCNGEQGQNFQSVLALPERQVEHRRSRSAPASSGPCFADTGGTGDLETSLVPPRAWRWSDQPLIIDDEQVLGHLQARGWGGDGKGIRHDRMHGMPWIKERLTPDAPACAQ